MIQTCERIFRRVALLTFLVLLLTVCGYLCWKILELPMGRASRYGLEQSVFTFFVLCIIFLPTLFAILRDDEKLSRTFLPNLLCPILLVILFYWPGSLRMMLFSVSVGVEKSFVFLTWAFTWFQFLSFDRKPMVRLGFGFLCLSLFLYVSLVEAVFTDISRNADHLRSGAFLILSVFFAGFLFVFVIPCVANILKKIRDPAGNKEIKR